MKKSNKEFSIGELVLYKNNQLIAFNKPAGIPVQNDPEGDKSLHALGEIYVHHPLNLIHRIDRPASGVVLFAQTKNALVHLNEQFSRREVEKIYLAVVPEKPAADEGELRHFLKKDSRSNRVTALDQEADDTQEALLHYRYLGSSEHYHLLEINLHSGRHHQIRAQLAAIGNPIRGDVKYGFKRGNRDRSIQLHAWKLSFRHPVSGQRETIVAPLPDDPVWNAFSSLLI